MERHQNGPVLELGYSSVLETEVERCAGSMPVRVTQKVLSMCKVVHVNKEDYDVYIGRPSKWGNPFTHIADKETLAQHIVTNREEALEKFKEYFLNNQELMDSIMELDGKVLGCWCIQDSTNPPFPFQCHGQVIQSILTNLKLKNVLRNSRERL